ncbi:MAG: M56 family metallopeptidase [Niastella sp.]|nr:M56 family metallopeptidase [Niastella sp.]
MVFLLYFLKMVVCSGVLMVYYWLFLRNKRFHHYNRFFLLGTLGLSLLLPLASLPVIFDTETPVQSAAYKVVQAISLPTENVTTPATAVTPIVVNETESKPVITAAGCLWILYWAGAAWLLLALVRSLYQLFRLHRQYQPSSINGLRIYNTTAAGTPFSFFRSIFWNQQMDISGAAGQKIFRHEVFHCRQLHSLDILLTELVLIGCWFNPFFWLLKKELSAIHEFLADQYAAADSDPSDYAQLLVLQVAQANNRKLNHYFFTHPIKRRITMILSSNPTRFGYLSRIMTLPVVLVLAGTIAVKAQQVASKLPEGIPADMYFATDNRGMLAVKSTTLKKTPVYEFKTIKEVPGNGPDISIARLLQKEITNMKQVQEKLGAPRQKTLSSGESVWSYTAGGKSLRIVFDRATDTIQSFHYVQFGKSVAQKITYEQVKSIKEGETTGEMITQLFGKPANIFVKKDAETWQFELPNQQLSIEFDVLSGKQLVRSFNYNEHNPDYGK